MPTPPVLVKEIPAQIINEGAAYGPFDLKQYIQSPDDSGELRFTGELIDGRPFPKGLVCTQNGIISGIPAPGTRGAYEFVIIAENDSESPLLTQFSFTIKERIALDTELQGVNFKSQVWEALGKNLPLPDLGEVMNRAPTPIEIYYLLQRWATLTIWDVYNLDTPGEKKLLQLEGCSPHYQLWDRGSCLIAAPKDLYSHERTLEDALQTAKVLAREVYKRGWVIEFAGFDKMVRAAWVELKLLEEKHGKALEVLHYNPSPDDLKVFKSEFKTMASKGFK